jgi:hypothetical protein
MLRMCVCMHFHFVENHPIRILEDGPLISEVALSQGPTYAKGSYEGTNHVVWDSPPPRTKQQTEAPSWG